MADWDPGCPPSTPPADITVAPVETGPPAQTSSAKSSEASTNQPVESQTADPQTGASSSKPPRLDALPAVRVEGSSSLSKDKAGVMAGAGASSDAQHVLASTVQDGIAVGGGNTSSNGDEVQLLI